MFNRLFNKSKHLIIQCLLPYTCLLCQCPADDKDLCQYCQPLLIHREQCCIQCGIPLKSSSQTHCGPCITDSPFFDRTYFLGLYEDPLRNLIIQFKFHEKLAASAALAMLFVENNPSVNLPHCLIPVPLSTQRLRERGFNQSLLLAKTLGKILHIPVLKHHLKKCRHTLPQTQLHEKKRARNVRDAFVVTTPLPYQHVALIDDVMTTGSTVNEIARLLKKQGVSRVDVWCIARTH